MLDALASHYPNYKVRQWRDANAMLRELDERLPTAALISLDHDLYVIEPWEPDPGDGLMVVNRLAELTPCCPVIVHSSNSVRAGMMNGELELSGWTSRRILPFGDHWVEQEWIPLIGNLIARERAAE